MLAEPRVPSPNCVQDKVHGRDTLGSTMSDQLFTTEEQDDAGGAVDPNAPLPARMRPRTVSELVGQEHVLGEGSVLRRAIEEGRPFSMVLYGPPGSGKT